MAPTQDDADQRAAYWPVAVARAVPAAGAALWITFSADHSAGFGLLVFGVFGVIDGLVLGAGAWFRLASSRVRAFFLAQAAVTVVAGILALILQRGGIAYFFLIVTGFAAITGCLELSSGLRTRKRFAASTDWLTLGGLTVVTAIAFLVLPPGYRQTFTGPDGVRRVLDSAVVSVGLFGAYAAIAAVYLIIAGLSAKWGTQSAARVVAVTQSTEGESKA